MSIDARQYKHVFGPVPSRRLGRSLGVDLVPFKVCPFDCVYCQLGRTTLKTDRRAVYVPTREVLAEIRAKLAQAQCDCVTLSGSGEPTLHAQIGRIIDGLKAMTNLPVVVITNGALLGDPEVRRGLLRADIVMPDLDAGDERTFQRINRPCGGLKLAGIVAGLKAFRREYSGKLNLEVFLVAGVNDSDRQVRRMKAIIDEIRPDSIDVNTVARPPAQEYARAVKPARLERLCRLLGPKARVIAPRGGSAGAGAVSKDDIVSMLRRHPGTLDDLAAGLKADRGEVAGLVAGLADEGKLTELRQAGGSYFIVAM